MLLYCIYQIRSVLGTVGISVDVEIMASQLGKQVKKLEQEGEQVTADIEFIPAVT